MKLKYKARFIRGDCNKKLNKLKKNSIDTCITDPPYGINFMGKKWDYDIPSVKTFKKIFRVLKPGAMLLCFGGSRTFHRIAVNIEDAGFQLRDTIMWIYSTGFPKSYDISKGIDKAAGAEFEKSPASGVGFMNAEVAGGYNVTKNKLTLKGEKSDSAKEWQGYGTALKPAFEPIILAMKPLDGNFVNNALTHGVAGLNIDGGRVGTSKRIPASPAKAHNGFEGKAFKIKERSTSESGFNPNIGRFPANIIHDGSEEVVRGFPDTMPSKSGIRKNKSGMGIHDTEKNTFGKGDVFGGFDDSGSASRFFYCAKASKKERNAGLEGVSKKESGFKNSSGRGLSRSNQYKKLLNENTHPTVKPLALMEYLCKITRPPHNGIVLDPFMGSGTTGIACKKIGRQFIGIEKDKEYFRIARQRIKKFRRKNVTR